jgi:hypothetical protein
VTLTSTLALALCLTACGQEQLVAAGPLPGNGALAVSAFEAPAHRTSIPAPSATQPVAPPTATSPAAAPTATATAVPSPAPSVEKATPRPTAPATPKPVKVSPAPAPKPTAAAAAAAKPAPAVPAASRPTSYRGVPIINADPDGYPGAWGTASAQAIWVYPATPARYVQSVIMHEYMHVLQFRAGWTDVASTHGERVADAGEQLLGGSYFKYTKGSPTASELAQARALLGG